MYEKRIKIFVILSSLLLFLCMIRLIQMQLLPTSSVQSDVRGKILDRAGNELAIDEPHFQMCIDYQFSSFMDDRVRQSKLLTAAGKEDPDAVAKAQKALDIGLEDLNQVIDKCAQFRGVQSSNIRAEIQRMNDDIWNSRAWQAWRRNFPNSELFNKYDNILSIPDSEAMADFEAKEPNETERIRLINKIDLVEMHQPWMLLELETDDDIFAAQLEFLKVDGIQILPKARRLYPYGTVASQTIGWVSPVTQEKDQQLFKDDKLASYLADELGGREDGVEYICEAMLRGRRGEEFEDIDSQIVSRTEVSFGTDVKLTLDIELQEEIENYLANYPHEPNCGPGMAAVVIEVATSDILALVSMPVYNLNRARYDYNDLVNNPDKPMINRAINERYPPGSVVKPLILVAGLESGKITPEQTISCPAQKAPQAWPNCLLFKRSRTGHDGRWENYARNAIRGSCNIYFSRLAHRIDSQVLQQWLFSFGYGQTILFPPPSITQNEIPRNFRQLSGVISNIAPRKQITDFEQMPPLRDGDKRWFGIGQGDLRATPLQVANSMATIARGGVFKLPRLFKSSVTPGAQNTNYDSSAASQGIDLEISLGTLAVIYDAMSAVVNEMSGTANPAFAEALPGLAEKNIKVYGKTGSTQNPEHALFGGFVVDGVNKSIAIAVVVEGGQSGSGDAAPLARDIIHFCIEDGYIGQMQTTE
ncbi:MAG: peptidoglycan D,D-transpeptidase FtsI family protein [Planctomycetota bacterium]|jgi:penicillin-binding protein 2